MLDDDDEEVFINTPKSVKKKKVNIPAFKGIGNVKIDKKYNL